MYFLPDTLWTDVENLTEVLERARRLVSIQAFPQAKAEALSGLGIFVSPFFQRGRKVARPEFFEEGERGVGEGIIVQM